MLKMFYDDACYLCITEVQMYERKAPKGLVEWIDIANPSFDARSYGLESTSVHLVLYAVDQNGQLFLGVDAFLAVWKNMPGKYPLLGKIVGSRIIKPFAKVLYTIFAKIRPW